MCYVLLRGMRKNMVLNSWLVEIAENFIDIFLKQPDLYTECLCILRELNVVGARARASKVREKLCLLQEMISVNIYMEYLKTNKNKTGFAGSCIL